MMKPLKTKLSIAIFIAMFFCLKAKSQEAIRGKVVPLHPVIGEIITKDEKIKYSLFPEIKDSLFQNALLISYPNGRQSFLIKPTNSKGESFEKPTNMYEMAEMFSKIDNTPVLSALDESIQRINHSPHNEYYKKTGNVIEETQGYPDKLTKKDIGNFGEKFVVVIGQLDELVVDIFKFCASVNGTSL